MLVGVPLWILGLVLLTGLSTLWAGAMTTPMVWQGYDVYSRTVWRVGATCRLADTVCGKR